MTITTKIRLFKYTENFTTQNWMFSDKNSDIFHISAQNIDCGYSLEPPRRGGSNEYQQSMFLNRYKKNYVYPCKHQFYYIKGFKGSKLYRYVFVMVGEEGSWLFCFSWFIACVLSVVVCLLSLFVSFGRLSSVTSALPGPLQYRRLSISRIRLSRIITYLKVKVWSLL